MDTGKRPMDTLSFRGMWPLDAWTMASQTSVMDVPLAWLAQLISIHLDTASRKAMFQTCKAFRRMVLAGSGKVKCELSTGMSPDAVARNLQLLTECKKGADVELVLQAEVLQTDSSCFHGSEYLFWDGIVFRMLSSQLHSVTSVEVKGALSGPLVPTPLCEHCPNMRRFKRTGMFTHELDPQETTALCAQLQELILVNLQPPGKQNRWSWQDMAQQLSSLPGLQSFHCVHEAFNDGLNGRSYVTMTEEWTSWLTKCVACLGPQLRNFQMPFELPPSSASLWEISWPRLRTLHLPLLQASTRDFKLLLENAPQLRDLRVSSAVTNSNLSDKRCRWEQLTVMGAVTVETLAKLPISGLQDLSLACLTICPEDLAFMHEATQALSSISNLHSLDEPNTLYLHVSCMDEPGVWAAAPLLQLFPQSHLWLSGNHKSVGNHWLDVLAQLHFAKVSICPRMLGDVCLAALPQSCPNMEHLNLYLDDSRTVMSQGRVLQLSTQVSMLCVLAPQALTLELDASITSQLNYRWVQEAVLGMQSAGHQRVNIMLWGDQGADGDDLGTSDEEAFDAADDDSDGDDNSDIDHADDNNVNNNENDGGVDVYDMADNDVAEAPAMYMPFGGNMGGPFIHVEGGNIDAPAIHMEGGHIEAPAYHMEDGSLDAVAYYKEGGSLDAVAYYMEGLFRGPSTIQLQAGNIGAPAMYMGHMHGGNLGAPASYMEAGSVGAPAYYVQGGNIGACGNYMERDDVGAPAYHLQGGNVGASAGYLQGGNMYAAAIDMAGGNMFPPAMDVGVGSLGAYAGHLGYPFQ